MRLVNSHIKCQVTEYSVGDNAISGTATARRWLDLTGSV